MRGLQRATLVGLLGSAAGLAWLHQRLGQQRSEPPPSEPGRHDVRILETRNEAGDETGWGAKVCRAPAEDPAHWTCRSDHRKYDSPFMFWHDGEAYLVGRRNLHGRGAYDLGRGAGWLLRTVWNQVNYSLARKRTALWRYVQEEDRIAWVMDLPSRGDACFPAVLPGSDPEEVVIYDYSCDLDGPDLPWIRGQRGETFIYRHRLTFVSG